MTKIRVCGKTHLTLSVLLPTLTTTYLQDPIYSLYSYVLLQNYFGIKY